MPYTLAARTRVLCTFGAAFDGGTHRVLADGLPHLNRDLRLRLSFADLYSRPQFQREFADMGIATRDLGVQCPPFISFRSGLGRLVDSLRAVPDHWRIVAGLRRALQQADVVYVHTYKELVLATVARSLDRTRRPAIVWHCHGLDGAPPFAKTFARGCRCVIAISGFVAGTLAGMGLPPEQIRTVVNAIDFDRVRASAAIPPASPLPRRVAPGIVLLPAASLRPVKGMHALLQAAKLVPDAQVWLTGDTHDPAAAQYVSQLLAIASSPELTGRVHFLGFRPDIYSVMQAADIVCVPSTYLEGFGLVAAEAMCLGKPVIVSNRGALPEVAAHGEAALVIDPDQPASLAKAIEKLIVQKNYASRLGIAARTSAIQRFSYVRWAREVAAVLAAGASVAPTVRQPITDTVSTESPYESVR